MKQADGGVMAHTRVRLLLTRFCAGLSLAFAVAMPGHAALTTPIGVSLIAPGGDLANSAPFTLTQTLSVAISPGDGGDIGNYMLPLEGITLSGDSILLTSAQGDSSGGTGIYGSTTEHARYEFAGLAIAGRTILGFNVYACDGFLTSCTDQGVLSGIGVSLIDSDSNSSLDKLIFNLDELLFRDRGQGESENFANFRIDILSRDDDNGGGNGVPEPGSAALALVALAGMRLAAQRCHTAKHGHTGS